MKTPPLPALRRVLALSATCALALLACAQQDPAEPADPPEPDADATNAAPGVPGANPTAAPAAPEAAPAPADAGPPPPPPAAFRSRRPAPALPSLPQPSAPPSVVRGAAAPAATTNALIPPPGPRTPNQTPPPGPGQPVPTQPAGVPPAAVLPGTVSPIAGTPPPPTAAAAAAGSAPLNDSLGLKNAELEDVFREYSLRTGKTVLSPSNLKVQISLFTAVDAKLTSDDVVRAIEGALSLNGVTLIPMGDKFMKAVPSNLAMQEGAALSFREAKDLPDAEEFVTQVIKLKVAFPTEIAQLLSQFSKAPQGIVPIDSSQILVIRDTASNVKRMLQLIDRVDIEPTSEYKLEILPIRYGRVADIFDTMSSLIGGGGGGSGMSRTTGAGAVRTSAGAARTGMGAGRLGSSSRGSGAYGSGAYGTGTYGSGTYGSGANRLGGNFGTQAGAINPTTGQPVAAGTTAGTTFQQRLNQVMGAGAQGGASQVLGDARIVPDERSNSLIVYANRQDMQMITNIVNKVDVLLAQVLIEGIVVSVSLGDQKEFGVSWYQHQKNFGNGVTGVGAINNGFFGVLTNLPSSSPSGFSYWGRLGDDIQVALTAMASDSKVRVLQRPRIQTSHAVPGVFFSGSTVPYVTGFYDYGGYGGTGLSTRSQVQQMEVGVSLNVTPYITPDGLVVLDLYQDISQLGEYVKIDNNDVPTTTSRSAQATLSVRDGETIMLGGYIEDSRSSGKSGVPILKDIPGLGMLFRSSKDKNSRAELILLMRVTVLKTPTDASALATRERGRLPSLNKAQKEFDKLEDPAPLQ